MEMLRCVGRSSMCRIGRVAALLFTRQPRARHEMTWAGTWANFMGLANKLHESSL
jgi:hypothetical protein